MAVRALSEELWPEERAIARPPERLTVSEWCDKHRVLDEINCAFPGRWRTAFTEYCREILDTVADHRAERIVLMCSTQVGKTEALINALLWTIANNPVPTLHVMPTEDEIVSFNHRRLKSAIDASPEVAQHRTRWKADWKDTELGFDGMVLYFAWANSASKLASKSIARLFLDEVDKYPAFTGKEADPISLAEERQRWFGDSQTILVSTPTTTQGYIWQHWQESDQRWFHVPCPFCGAFQPLKFSRETVRIPEDERDPVRIREHRLACYVCTECEREIPDDDEHKRRMVRAGVWCPEGGHVDRAGVVRGVKLDGPVRGYHVNALYSPMLSWSDVAAQFLRSQGDVAKLLNFTNSWLGWPWVEKATELENSAIRARAIEKLPASLAPRDAVVLTAGVDVQKGHGYYSIRAHMVGERSVVIAAHTWESWEALAAAVVHSSYPIDGDPNRKLPVRLVCIDSGYRTDEVYEFCAKYPDVCRPTKGQQSQAVPFTSTKLGRDLGGRVGGMLLWSFDTTYFKDKLARQIQAPVGAPGCWRVHAEPTDGFCDQMVGEHKVLQRTGKKGHVQAVWVQKPNALGNHWWDTEVLNALAADMLGVFTLRDETTEAGVSAFQEQQQTQRSPAEREERRRGGKFRQRKGWIRKRGER